MTEELCKSSVVWTVWMSWAGAITNMLEYLLSCQVIDTRDHVRANSLLVIYSMRWKKEEEEKKGLKSLLQVLSHIVLSEATMQQSHTHRYIIHHSSSSLYQLTVNHTTCLLWDCTCICVSQCCSVFWWWYLKKKRKKWKKRNQDSQANWVDPNWFSSEGKKEISILNIILVIWLWHGLYFQQKFRLQYDILYSFKDM